MCDVPVPIKCVYKFMYIYHLLYTIYYNLHEPFLCALYLNLYFKYPDSGDSLRSLFSYSNKVQTYIPIPICMAYILIYTMMVIVNIEFIVVFYVLQRNMYSYSIHPYSIPLNCFGFFFFSFLFPIHFVVMCSSKVPESRVKSKNLKTLQILEYDI